MNILVTGANGFIGKNLIVNIQALYPNVNVLGYTKGDESKLEDYIIAADIIVHLAGVQRPVDSTEFQIGNVSLTDKICDLLACHKKCIPVIFSSSIQVYRGNEYGNSKLAAESRLIDSASRFEFPLYIYRLPNVFGKFSKPNFNSFIATFCYNLLNDLPVDVHCRETPVKLLYIDDLCDSLMSRIFSVSSSPALIEFVDFDVCFDTTVGDVFDILSGFKQIEGGSNIPVAADGLQRSLYATYLSFKSPHQFTSPLLSHGDSRGKFCEVFKTNSQGQVSFFTGSICEVRGMHYHNTKNERFLVVHGVAEFKFKSLDTGDTHTLIVNSNEFKVVESIPGWVHSVKNIGDTELVVLLWANELFDPIHPDTYQGSTYE